MLERRRTHDPEGLALSLEHMGTLVQPSLWEKLGDLRLPVLFVAGADDDKYGRLAESMANLCSAGQKAIIPGAGHNTHWERPAEFCRLVEGFLTRQK